MQDIQLTSEQQKVIDNVFDWINSTDTDKDIFTLGGYAGTGKTTLISYIREKLPSCYSVAFVTFTAKASLVVGSKLKKSNSIKYKDFCGTIHSLIYEPVLDPYTNEIKEWKLKLPDEINFNLIIIDEASMVGEDILKDLLTYRIPILAVGDCFQLPPIEGHLNLMNHPDCKLITIHRQALESPIISLSQIVRDSGYIEFGNYGGTVAKVRGGNHPLVKSFIRGSKDFLDTMILCATNKTRTKINNKIRSVYGFESEVPLIGERLICLKNNYNAEECILVNGAQGILKNITDSSSHYEMVVEFDGEDKYFYGPVSKDGFLNPSPKFTSDKVNRFTLNFSQKTVKTSQTYMDYFDFGYCLSVHKSQGSQCKRVMVIEEYIGFWDQETIARWLYTAITRSEEQLLIVSPR